MQDLNVGSYFMTEQDQDAVLGRLLRQYKEQNELAIKLEVEAKRLGQELVMLGQALSNQPAVVAFPGQGVPINFGRHYEAKPSLFDHQRLAKLVEDYRQALHKRDEYADQLKRLGHSI